MNWITTYWDSKFNELAKQVHFGWVRFPGGASGDAYNWKTGEEEQAWFDQFAPYSAGPQPNVVELVAGRGGAHLEDAVEQAKLLGADLIVRERFYGLAEVHRGTGGVCAGPPYSGGGVGVGE